jgi:hypothetical protein
LGRFMGKHEHGNSHGNGSRDDNAKDQVFYKKPHDFISFGISGYEIQSGKNDMFDIMPGTYADCPSTFFASLLQDAHIYRLEIPCGRKSTKFRCRVI